MYDIEELLIEIEEHLHSAKKPLVGKGLIVDAEFIYDRIDKIRENYPDLIREAAHIVNNRERKDQELEARTQRILNEANERANRLLNDHSITLRAEESADVIIRQANEYKGKIYDYVKSEVDKLLSDTEKEIIKTLEIINDAKDKNNNYLLRE